MNDYLKYENTSNIIELIDLDNTKFIFKKINFRDSSQGKKNLFGDVDIQDIVKRAECLTKQRYKDVYNTSIILLKFFTLLKRIHKKKQLERGYKKKKNRNMNVKEEHIFTKVNNDITSFENLNIFQESKNENERSEKEEKNKFIINEINEKIKQFEIMKKEQLHQKLKERMHNLLFNEEDSTELNPNNINENELNNNGTLNRENSMNETFNEEDGEKVNKKNVVDNAKIRRKGIKTNVQLDNELKDFIPEFIPQYQTKYLGGLKNKISQKIYNKKNKNNN